MHQSKEIVLVKPLGPQPWGVIATRQFWASAVWSPLIIPYSLGMLLIVDLAEMIVGPLSWFQIFVLAFASHWLWGGLLERWTRHARRRKALRSPDAEG